SPDLPAVPGLVYAPVRHLSTPSPLIAFPSSCRRSFSAPGQAGKASPFSLAFLWKPHALFSAPWPGCGSPSPCSRCISRGKPRRSFLSLTGCGLLLIAFRGSRAAFLSPGQAAASSQPLHFPGGSPAALFSAPGQAAALPSPLAFPVEAPPLFSQLLGQAAALLSLHFRGSPARSFSALARLRLSLLIASPVEAAPLFSQLLGQAGLRLSLLIAFPVEAPPLFSQLLGQAAALPSPLAAAAFLPPALRLPHCQAAGIPFHSLRVCLPFLHTGEEKGDAAAEHKWTLARLRLTSISSVGSKFSSVVGLAKERQSADYHTFSRLVGTAGVLAFLRHHCLVDPEFVKDQTNRAQSMRWDMPKGISFEWYLELMDKMLKFPGGWRFESYSLMWNLLYLQAHDGGFNPSAALAAVVYGFMASKEPYYQFLAEKGVFDTWSKELMSRLRGRGCAGRDFRPYVRALVGSGEKLKARDS
ncbi:hypothetical protein CYMTET_31013, partial [Cymbomonas tetramitiformis]